MGLSFGDKLRAWVLDAIRETDGTQDKFIERVGVSKPTLNKALASIESLTIESVRQIAEATGHTLAEVFESRVPQSLSTEHTEIHEKLQAILETADPECAAWLCGNIKVFYRDAMHKKVLLSKKRRAG